MKATRINAKQAQGLINNEEERFNDQPEISTKVEMKLLKCFTSTYRTFFSKTIIQIKPTFAGKKNIP